MQGRDAQTDLPQSSSDAGHYEFPCLDARAVTHAPTFTAIYREIFCSAGCAAVYCHGARGASGGMALDTLDSAYQALVETPAGTQPTADGVASCVDSGLRRVDPGRPERSLLYLKVTGTAACGTPMPPGGTAWAALDAQQRTQVETWIRNGAKDDRRSEEDAGR